MALQIAKAKVKLPRRHHRPRRKETLPASLRTQGNPCKGWCQVSNDNLSVRAKTLPSMFLWAAISIHWMKTFSNIVIIVISISVISMHTVGNRFQAWSSIKHRALNLFWICVGCIRAQPGQMQGAQKGYKGLDHKSGENCKQPAPLQDVPCQNVLFTRLPFTCFVTFCALPRSPMQTHAMPRFLACPSRSQRRPAKIPARFEESIRFRAHENRLCSLCRCQEASLCTVRIDILGL